MKEKIKSQVRVISIDADHRINDIYFIDQMIGFAVGGSRYDEAYIFKTEDAGQTWNRIQENAININTETGLQTLNVANLKQGAYFIRVNNQTQTLIKQ